MSVRTRHIEYIRCVDYKAEELDRQGYSVKANIEGWSKPPTIEGQIPDIRAKRGNKTIIGKIVREDELETIEKNQKKLIGYAEKDANKSFRVYMISKDGKPKLHKIY